MAARTNHREKRPAKRQTTKRLIASAKNGKTVHEALRAFGISAEPSGAAIGGKWLTTSGSAVAVRSPIDGQKLASVRAASLGDLQSAIDAASEAFLTWRTVPAPIRGEFIRRVGQKLRERKEALAKIVTLEVGKITAEALGEVQEMIDIADFAVGLSRQLYGLTIASERPGHRMMEQWLPLGPIGVISAFNFPVAVWAWNAMLAWVCGDPVVWKPSEKTPLCAIACQQIVGEVLAEMPEVPPAVSCVVIGDGLAIGEAMAASQQLPLISATGSTRMGQAVAQTVAKRLGRSLLELGGNNAMILTPSADLELATRAIVFAAAGTAGQRCTTLRRLIVHKSIKADVLKRLTTIYGRLKIGDPRENGVLVGPLIDQAAFEQMQTAITIAKQQGGCVLVGGARMIAGVPTGGVYVSPAIVEISAEALIMQEETFAPILYVIEYDTLEQAIVIHNNVPQGLSSAILPATSAKPSNSSRRRAAIAASRT